ncbi:MAG: nitroreductase [Woeseiaceae bacterium]|nr:nitroreductase [Woeseiaceae bacterium]
MNVTDAVRKRHTTRGFKPDPVPDELLREILETARHAPSNCNTQPWFLTIVSGDARDRLEKALVSEIRSGKKPSPAFQPGDRNLEGVYRERQVACAVRYYQTMGIERHEKDKRDALMLRNWQFFGAPHTAFLSMPLTMGPVNAVDIGIYLQTLMLLMVERGLASCPQGALAFFPDPVREIAGIPDDHGILCGLSFGYADEAATINQARMDRDPLDRTVRLVT